jgi:O-antigen/teichoic acid export membrane protein
VLYSVSFPAFCRLRDDQARFHDWYEKIAVIIAITVTPLLLGLAAVADDFVLGILGPQWEGAIMPIRILAFAAAVNSQHALSGAAIEATGKIRYEVATQAIYAVLVVIGTLIGTTWGLSGVGAGILVASMTLYSLKAYTIRAATGLPLRRYLRPAIAPMIAGAVMYFAVRWGLVAVEHSWGALGPDHHIARLLSSVVFGAMVYMATLYTIAPHATRTLWEQISKLRGDLINRRNAQNRGGFS